jgi:DnaJ family protein C protein 9
MNHIPHSVHADESRFIVVISHLISKGELPSLPTWESSVKDEKSRLVREKQGRKEAKEAEALAKELGVWDEFYGSGKTGDRNKAGKGKEKKEKYGEEEDHSALQALILKKKRNMDSFFDDLATKYAEPEPKSKMGPGKGKRMAKGGDPAGDVIDESPMKKPKHGVVPLSPEINDEEFEKLQQKLFGNNVKTPDVDPGSKGKKVTKGRRAK